MYKTQTTSYLAWRYDLILRNGDPTSHYCNKQKIKSKGTASAGKVWMFSGTTHSAYSTLFHFFLSVFIACVAGIEGGRGIERKRKGKGVEERSKRPFFLLFALSSLSPSPSLSYFCTRHVGYVSFFNRHCCYCWFSVSRHPK